MKKSFTLLELIIVIVLISIVYYFTIQNLNFKPKKLDALTINNLQEYLSKIEFDDTIRLDCIDSDDMQCLLFVDENLQKTEKISLFKECPVVYEYSKQLKTLEFRDIELKNMESYRVCFSFEMTKNKKSSQFIVQTNQKIYVFNNINNKPIILKDVSGVYDYFEDKINEVKDAF